MSWSTAQYENTYTDYEVEMSYGNDTGLLIVPHSYNTKDLKSVSVIPRSQPASILVIKWQAKRVGGRPQLPDYEPSSSTGLVLLSTMISPQTTMLEGPDGITPTFMIRGVYVYQAPEAFALNTDGIEGIPTPYDSVYETSYGSDRDSYVEEDFAPVLPI